MRGYSLVGLETLMSAVCERKENAESEGEHFTVISLMSLPVVSGHYPRRAPSPRAFTLYSTFLTQLPGYGCSSEASDIPLLRDSEEQCCDRNSDQILGSTWQSFAHGSYTLNLSQVR